MTLEQINLMVVMAERQSVLDCTREEVATGSESSVDCA